MNKIDEFKEFVRKNPILIKHVKNNETNWQKLYEIYDLYGEDSNVWNEYLKDNKSIDIKDWFKNINIDSLQSGINNIQKVLELVQEITKKDDKEAKEYKPRPIYKHFED